ncbi:MAG TPA: CoA transferase [Acidimicrobiales bacterium]|nr:CoA transferase [Acidimicrobiales bacterium]
MSEGGGGAAGGAGRGGSLLEGLRVLDAAGEPAALSGRILADLGAEVLKLEPPGGDPLRRVPPLGPDGTSLRFTAWNAGKLLLEAEGPDDPLVAQLAADVDVVLTTPGWPGALELDPALAPGSVWVRVTPFGSDGPRAAWRASDLGVMASTGNMYCTGDPDRAPVRCTEPTAWAHVGPETVVATLTALSSGRPQVVEVSAQEAVMIASMGHVGRFPRTGNRGRRSGANIGATREIWPCRDGFVSFGLRGGKARVPNMQTITRLVDEEGLGTPALTERDWTTYDHTRVSAEELEAIAAPVAAYFARHTMAELYEVACATNLMLAPANSPRELVESRQLAARDFFCRLGGIEHVPRTFVHVRSPGEAVAQPGAGGPAEQGDPGAVRLTEAVPARARTPYVGPGPAPVPAPPGPAGAWAGTRILEFGAGAAGPIAIRYFAEHGAEVVRIESRSRPDFLRTYGMHPGKPCGLEGSDMYDALNVGKRSVTLNLKHPEGLALAKRLIRWADAVAENFAPRAMRGFGLDYATLAPEKPDLVMMSSCLQGQTGPHKDYPGFGGQGSALAGYNMLTGWPDREPVGPYGTITDSLAPRFAASALAAGLLYRRRTGRGVHLDVSQVEAAVYSLSPWVLDYDVNGHIGARQGNRSPRAVPHGAFPCAGEDRWVAVAAWDDGAWRALAGAMGLDAATTDRLGTLAARLDAVDEVEALVGAWTAQRRADEVAAELQALGIEAVPVADLGDASADPQLHHRRHFVTLTHPCMGECGYERNGFRLSDAPAGFGRSSPTLGQDNDYVLGEILGLGEAERRRLADDGILE